MVRPSVVRAWFLLAACVTLVSSHGQRACAQDARAGRARISLSASPTTLPADGKSRSRIRIEVRDRGGQLAPDGTLASCYIDHGSISAADADRQQSLSVTTAGGYATVYALSDTPGWATVTVRVQDGRNTATLHFVPKGEAAQAVARAVNIRGGWVGYCLDLNLLAARDGARAQLGRMVFETGDGLEIRIDTQELRGWGARIKIGKEVLEGEDFFYDLARRRGVLRRIGDNGVERVHFTSYGIAGAGAEWAIPEDAFRSDDREGVTWMVCRSCSYFIGQKVVVKHAKLFAGTQKVFSLPPYWVVGLPGYAGASNTQVVGLSTDGGLAVDLPFFYRVTDMWAGSVKIQRGASGTSFVARDGWTIGISEEYDTGEAKGAVELGGLFTSDWGLEWRDERQVFGENQAYFNVAWPDHRSVFADANVYHYGDDYRINFRTQFDDPYFGEAGYRAAADWLTDAQPLAGDIKYRLGVTAGTRKFDGDDLGWVFENELYGALEFKTIRLSSKASLTPKISNSYAWDTADFSANSLRGHLRLNQSFGSSARMGFNYYVNYRNGDTSSPGANHLVGLDLNVNRGAEWNTYLNGTWDITSDDTYGYAGFDWFFKPRLRFGLIGTHYSFDDIRYNDLEFELARAFGGREIGLRYSVDSSRLSLELGGLSF